MDMLLIATYVALAVAVFKIFKIPLNKWTVPTAFLGGVLLIGGLLTLMNYSHPYSSQAREYFYTTPISPSVKGRVVEVYAKANQFMKQGTPLFKLDSEPYEDKVKELEAKLIVAKKNQKRAQEMMRKGLGKQFSVDETTATVDSLTGALKKAQFDLAQTTVYAPTDGYVSQLFLKPGMYAVPMPLRPVMVFVNSDAHLLVAWFRQNSMMRLQPGFDAEVAFDGLPGEVFKGKVSHVLPVLAEGQLQANGYLLSDTNHRPGLIPVQITITDPRFEKYKDRVLGGAYGQAAVYSDHFHHLSVIRKVLLRMSSWMNYVFPMH
ncbi:MAG: HlyD family secretion protein [Thiotrichales bacterium]|nr:HlyD family secretion protein [Thiotrichales bacterium]